MRYYWRVFRFENGSEQEEFTEHMAAPFFHEGCLNQTINTAELILESMPISTKKAFPPKTKFRIKRFTTEDYSDEPKIFDMVVETDRVEEYPSCPEICCHRIEMISPSVAAQGMHTDNISLTYELQDATLNYKTTISDSSHVSVLAVPDGYQTPLRQTDSLTFPDGPSGGVFPIL